jgi:hypothetical protein
MRNLIIAISFSGLVMTSASAQQPPDPFKVMITEVSWDEPDGLELTNFDSVPVDLSGWRVLWHDAVGPTSSSSLNVVLGPGQSLVVLEENPAPALEIPAGVPVVTALPVLSTTSEAFVVAVLDPMGVMVDEVVITDTAGNSPAGASPSFRGWARRGQLFPSRSVERIWGLDSDGGRDWTEETNRGFGLESRSSGARNGSDPIQVQPVWINEIDTSPDYVELVNRSGSPLDIVGWYFLVSEAQGAPLRMVTPWPTAFVLGHNEYVVIGDGSSPPNELPVTPPAPVPYIQLTAGANLSLGSAELTLGLFDRLGRLVDLVRTTREASTLVHNHPRVPSWPLDFLGAAPRLLAGDRSFGRANTMVDTNTGGDWRALNARTMGSGNAFFVGEPGHQDVYDVRVNEGVGDGLTAILNAGVVSANHGYSFFLSQGHLNGEGPFFGLGSDALLNWIALRLVPPFSGTLDGLGSARFDFPAGTPGLQFDCVFIVQLPNGVVSKRTLIVQYDT